MSQPILMTVIAISGACVLAIEILGTRMLGPFYGVSLFLWSALISVTLAALSAGYAIGGRWADRGPTAARLAALLAAAGVWMLLVPWMRGPLVTAVEGWGLRAAVLAAATVLFFPPLTLLGMVSPYAIRLRARTLDEVGRSAGSVFAVSTLASVAAALATGFWLIPNMGVTRLTVAIGLALLVGAGIARLGAPGGRAAGAAGFVVALIAGGAAWGLARAPVTEGTRFAAESAYARIEVRDWKNVRHLLIDGGVHTAVRADNGAPVQEYVVVSELAHELFERPGDMLLVGLGGGAAAHAFDRSGWRIEAVEIDPVVTRVAREWFDLDRSGVRVAHMDGRRFLATADAGWDLIFFDAYGSSSIPFHLATLETFRLARDRLRPGGVLMLNVEAVGWHHPLVASLGATLGACFENVLALPIREPPDRLGNLILLASDRPLEIPDERLGDPVAALVDTYEHWRVVQRNHAWDNRFKPGGGLVITDDRNPVDLWSEQIKLVARRDLRAYFSADES